VCVCVCERERERARASEGERERAREFESAPFISASEIVCRYSGNFLWPGVHKLRSPGRSGDYILYGDS